MGQVVVQQSRTQRANATRSTTLHTPLLALTSSGASHARRRGADGHKCSIIFNSNSRGSPQVFGRLVEALCRLQSGVKQAALAGGLLGSLGLDPPLAVPRGQEGEQLPLDEQTAHVTNVLRH